MSVVGGLVVIVRWVMVKGVVIMELGRRVLVVLGVVL